MVNQGEREHGVGCRARLQTTALALTPSLIGSRVRHVEEQRQESQALGARAIEPQIERALIEVEADHRRAPACNAATE